MTIIINNQPTETQATTLQQLADELALPAKGVAIAISNRIVPRTDWTSRLLSQNESIFIIKAACGG